MNLSMNKNHDTPNVTVPILSKIEETDHKKSFSNVSASYHTDQKQ